MDDRSIVEVGGGGGGGGEEGEREGPKGEEGSRRKERGRTECGCYHHCHICTHTSLVHRP